MHWNVKKIKETETTISIGFSKNDSIDGLIEYDKNAEVFKLISIAKDCDKFESERLFQFLYALILQEKLSYEVYSINIG